MNTPVNFEIAKLLKEKGFDEHTESWYDKDGDGVYKDGEGSYKFHLVGECYAPTIAEVVMWLYEKHGIWICVDKSAGFDWWKFNIRILKDVGYAYGEFGSDYNSPTEAYSAGIEYTLKNLIK